ncbi:MAG: hypothetical protein COT15_02170 [Candidatus Diapherotrites archaeon CG08_land_8_20_14_0_20_34_12]|nr:MAG: hypothetical protein COT15_02170 [Candidatus Diapherotrites archaeon CG08_land_8_20_14_0_20_34_12]
MVEQTLAERNPQLNKFLSFYEQECKKQIEHLVQKYPEERSLAVDFKELERFDFELADELLENPDNLIKSAEQAIENIEVPSLQVEKFAPHIRFFNLPDDRKILLRNLGSAHLNKLICVEGVIKQITDVLPKLKKAAWQCRRCGNVYKVEQDSTELKKPAFCDCRHKDFSLVEEESDFVDYQKIIIQESLEALKGNEQPTDIQVYMSDDLVNKVSAGDKIIIVGILRLGPLNKEKAAFTRYLQVRHLDRVEREFEDIVVSEEEEEEIKQLAKDPQVFNKLVKSLAPGIYGHEMVKEAIILQLFGGVKKVMPNEQKIRGNIHILLVGEPGVAKSQMLLAANSLSPKGIYIAGKTSSGAGISATAVKDEFGEGGWTIKAGALVLASGGVAFIDELDKMDSEDRGAMHESLEQQSYHKDFEIMLVDGSKHKIGKLVDSLFENNLAGVIQGKDCEILEVDNLQVITTDFNNLNPINVSGVSRHKAPDHFVKVTYSTGRSIVVTPDHPIFVFENNNFVEKSAHLLKKGMFCPAAKKIEIITKNQSLLTEVSVNGRKELFLPEQMNPNLGAFLGYVASEGHSYFDESNSYAEIGVSNTDPIIINHMTEVFKDSFKSYLNINSIKASNRAKATKDITTVRCCSLPLYNYFKNNFNELVAKSPFKRIPAKVLSTSPEIQAEFLKAAFSGDGFIDSERFGFSTASLSMAEDYADLLLQFGIISRIQKEERKGHTYYKIVISGTNSMKKFLQFVLETDKRLGRLNYFIKRSSAKLNEEDFIPNCLLHELNALLKSLKLSDGSFVLAINKNYSAERKKVIKHLDKIYAKIKLLKSLDCESPRKIRKLFNLTLEEVANSLDLSKSMVTYIERNPRTKQAGRLLLNVKKLASDKLSDLDVRCSKIKSVVDSDLRFVTVAKTEIIPNIDSEWVYDVTVEPTKNFISAGLVLHNSISVAKAGITTRFKTETSVLAASNPKYSRFDPYTPYLEQIDLPPTLISRFDLFFLIKDVLDRKKDLEIATHILKTHQGGEKIQQQKNLGKKISKEEWKEIEERITPPIPTELVKKYISYGRQKMFPVLSKQAIALISDFYVGLREKGKQDGNYAATHRQLEGLIRLSEASARVRLSDTVDIEDANRAIRLFEYCLEGTVKDPETGKIDIDILTSGKSHSQTESIKKILRIIKDKSAELDEVTLEDVLKEGEVQGIDRDKAKDYLEDLHKKGDIYYPRHNIIKPASKQ